MKLIEYDGESIKVADEAFLVKPIRELYEQDKSKRKEIFWEQMSYLYFMTDPRSPYQYLTDPQERASEIKLQEGLSLDWVPSETLQKAIKVYAKQTVTTSALLLESMRKGIEGLRSFFDTAKLTDVDDKGKPLYQVAAFTGALKQIPELAKALADAEKSLAKDFADEAQARGSVSKSIDEDD